MTTLNIVTQTQKLEELVQLLESHDDIYDYKVKMVMRRTKIRFHIKVRSQVLNEKELLKLVFPKHKLIVRAE